VGTARTAPLLLFTIDVEEDMPGWCITDPITTRNVAMLERLAEACAQIGVRPTYLCTFPTVTQTESARVLERLARAGACELGTHMHSWNTPPFLGVPGLDGQDERQVAYYQSALGAERFRAKLHTLHDAVAAVAGRAPTSFRAGRFGIDAATLAELPPFGYQVDSSITPLEEHLEDGGPDFRGAPRYPYRPSSTDVTRLGDLPIVEIPVSVGLTRRVPHVVQRAFVHLPKTAHLRGFLSRDYLGIVDFAWLYPARFDLPVMRAAVGVMVRERLPVINVFIHSSELVPGASGRIHTSDDASACQARVRGLLEHCLSEIGARPATLTEAGRELAPALGLPA
jgi:hypothetical protein